MPQIKSNTILPEPLDASQSGITLLLVVLKFGLNYNREVLINIPLEYGNAMLVPPIISYSKGGIHSWL